MDQSEIFKAFKGSGSTRFTRSIPETSAQAAVDHLVKGVARWIESNITDVMMRNSLIKRHLSNLKDAKTKELAEKSMDRMAQIIGEMAFDDLFGSDAMAEKFGKIEGVSKISSEIDALVSKDRYRKRDQPLNVVRAIAYDTALEWLYDELPEEYHNPKLEESMKVRRLNPMSESSGAALSSDAGLNREISRSQSSFERNLPTESFTKLAEYISRNTTQWLRRNAIRFLESEGLLDAMAEADDKDKALFAMHDAAMELSKAFALKKMDLSVNISSYLAAVPGFNAFVKRRVGETLYPRMFSVEDAVGSGRTYGYSMLVYDAVVSWLYDELPDEDFRSDLLERRSHRLDALFEAKKLTQSNIDTLKRNDTVVVYHGTIDKYLLDFLNGMDTTRQQRRVYGGPTHAGLFVSPTFKDAKRFGSTRLVIEFETKVRNLHGTDWNGRTRREAERAGEDMSYWDGLYPDSFDGWLSNSLRLDGGEPQALHKGLIRPGDILRVYWNGEWYTPEEMEGMTVNVGYGGDKEIRILGVDLSDPKLSVDDLVVALERLHDIRQARWRKVLGRMPKIRFKTKSDFADSLQSNDYTNIIGVKLGRAAAEHVANQIWTMESMMESQGSSFGRLEARLKKYGKGILKQGFPFTNAEDMLAHLRLSGTKWLRRYGERAVLSDGLWDEYARMTSGRGANATASLHPMAFELAKKMKTGLYSDNRRFVSNFLDVPGMVELAYSELEPVDLRGGKRPGIARMEKSPEYFMGQILYDVAAEWLFDELDAMHLPDDIATEAKLSQVQSVLMARFLELVESSTGDLSRSDFDALERDVRSRFGVGFDLGRLEPGDDFEPPIIELSSIVVPKDNRRRGLGTEVMEYFARWADSNGVMIALDPSSNFGSSVAGLRRFYKRFGFISNKGRNKDFRTMRAMIRMPQVSESLEEATGDGPILYHVTFLANMESVRDRGLVPSKSFGSNYTSAYAQHSRGKVFLTSKEGVKFWMSRMEDVAEDQTDDAVEDGMIPVVIRVDASDVELEADELGSRDARADAFATKQGIHPSRLEVFDGQRFIGMLQLEVADLYDAARDAAQYEEEDDGEEYVIPDYDVFRPRTSQLKESKESDRLFGELRSELTRLGSADSMYDFEPTMGVLALLYLDSPDRYRRDVAPYAKRYLLKGLLLDKVEESFSFALQSSVYGAFLDVADGAMRFFPRLGTTIQRDEVIAAAKKDFDPNGYFGNELKNRVLSWLDLKIPSSGFPSSLSRIVTKAFDAYLKEFKRSKPNEIIIDAYGLDKGQNRDYFKASSKMKVGIKKHAKEFLGAFIDDPTAMLNESSISEGSPVGRTRRVGKTIPYSKVVEKPEKKRKRQVLVEGDSILAYKIMRFDPSSGKAVSGADSRQGFRPRKGMVVSMPGKGIFLSPNREFVVDYYAGHDHNILLVLSVDPEDVTGGNLTDRESEFTARRATIVDFVVADEDDVDDLY